MFLILSYLWSNEKESVLVTLTFVGVSRETHALRRLFFQIANLQLGTL